MERSRSKRGGSSTSPDAVLFVVVGAAGWLLATRWAHVVATISRHSTVGEVAVGVAIGAAPLIGFGVASDRSSRRGLQFASLAVLAWVVGTQPYVARAWRDPSHARVYQRVVPGYSPGLGVGVVIAVLALLIHAAVKKNRTEPPVDAEQPT